MKEHIVLGLEVGLGIIAAFYLWTYVSPMLSSVSPTPSA